MWTEYGTAGTTALQPSKIDSHGVLKHRYPNQGPTLTLSGQSSSRMKSSELSDWLESSRTNIESLSIRMVAGYREGAERKTLVVAEARYVPNYNFCPSPSAANWSTAARKSHVYKHQVVNAAATSQPYTPLSPRGRVPDREFAPFFILRDIPVLGDEVPQ
jgi:hypothetical protein